MSKLDDIEAKAQELFDAHSLDTWTFEYDRAGRRYGLCKHRDRVITMSAFMVAVNPIEESIDTLLHEMSHAIVGPGHGHNHVWRRKAIELGCSGSRTYSNLVIEPKAPFLMGCPSCNIFAPRHRRKLKVERYRCGRCKGPIVFKENS